MTQNINIPICITSDMNKEQLEGKQKIIVGKIHETDDK